MTESRPFLNWAFGPSGIVSLRMVVYGDWSGDRRFARHNGLAVRNSSEAGDKGRVDCCRVDGPTYNWYWSPFCNLPQDIQDLLEQHESLITACPVELPPLFS